MFNGGFIGFLCLQNGLFDGGFIGFSLGFHKENRPAQGGAANLSKTPKLAADARKQRYAGLRESAAAQVLGALFRNLNRRLWHCRAKSSFRLTAVSR